MLGEDLRHYSRFCYGGRSLWRVLPRLALAHPAIVAVWWYRVGAAAWRCPVPVVKQLLQLIYLLGMPWARLYSGVQIQPQTRIGPGLVILHFGGVVITRECEIGRDCVLYHNVNIVTAKSRQGPRIGDAFYAGVGVTLIGDIVIEDHVTCGAGSVVTRSIPSGAIVAGVPARIVRFRTAADDFTENRSSPKGVTKWMVNPADGAVVEQGEP